MFISFEGIDGSGKTTQLQILATYLESIGYEVMLLREPGGVPLSESVRDLLLNSSEEINPITELLLFEASRSHLVHSLIKPAIAQGKIILCDRFLDSTTAYQGYGRGIDLDIINTFNSIATLGIMPDLTFYLDVDFATAENRSDRKIYDRIESAGKEFYLRVIQGFRELASNYPERIFRIDASRELDVTSALIKQIIDSKLNDPVASL